MEQKDLLEGVSKKKEITEEGIEGSRTEVDRKTTTTNKCSSIDVGV